MDPGQELNAADVVNQWDERRLARLLREYGEERFAARIARALVRPPGPGPAVHHPGAGGGDQVGAAGARGVRRRPSRQAQLPGASGSRSTTSWPSSIARCPPPGSVLAPGGRMGVICFHSLEDRRSKRFMAARARGCVCPPDLPVCGCGRLPEGDLLVRGAVTPTPGEMAANPRSLVGPPARHPPPGAGMSRAATATARRTPVRARPAPTRARSRCASGASAGAPCAPSRLRPGRRPPGQLRRSETGAPLAVRRGPRGPARCPTAHWSTAWCGARAGSW